jgi:hypothetical protein
MSINIIDMSPFPFNYPLPCFITPSIKLLSNQGGNISASCTHQSYIKSCSILIFIPSMRDFSCDASLVVMEQAMTGRDTPQALPRAILLHYKY